MEKKDSSSSSSSNRDQILYTFKAAQYLLEEYYSGRVDFDQHTNVDENFKNLKYLEKNSNSHFQEQECLDHIFSCIFKDCLLRVEKSDFLGANNLIKKDVGFLEIGLDFERVYKEVLKQCERIKLDNQYNKEKDKNIFNHLKMFLGSFTSE